MLSDTVAFLMATCDQNVGQELNTRMDIIINNWEQLFGFVEKFMHSGDINRNKKEYQKGLEKLDAWLRHVEEVLNLSQKVESESMRNEIHLRKAHDLPWRGRSNGGSPQRYFKKIPAACSRTDC